MARAVILPSQTSTQTLLFAIPRIPLTTWKLPFMSRQVLCKCSSAQAAPAAAVVDMAKYKEAFAKRMAMAGLKPHHRLAIGVSGGPDSMALCVLSAHWKKAQDFSAKCDNGGFIDGLLAIIVDHGLRAESKEEANTVSNRVSKMGIRSCIACCDWPDGHPKQGHLQEAARDMRYEMFQNICIQNRIGVLLIAHHADDQAELFVLRLSRNSGVLGLAGMPFTSQIFSTHTHSCAEVSRNHGILVVRPLLDLVKEDMYKICEGSNQVWVEDPTNQSQLYARNRIRLSLKDSTCAFRSELQAVIAACCKIRRYVDHICSNLISQAVTFTDLGYAVIDLEILNQSEIEDICMTKFIALVLKFISQRNRPIRGSTSKLLLNYMRTLPCKTSFTAAGCYISPAPGSRGMKALVCVSVDSPLPLKMGLSRLHFQVEQEHSTPDEIEQIISDSKSYADSLVPNKSDVHFLEGNPESILTGARKLGMISESTRTNILLLHQEEIKNFKSSKVAADYKSEHGVKSASTSRSEQLQPGQICCFMDRFFVTWNLSEEDTDDATSEEANLDGVLEAESRYCCCRSCGFGHDTVVEVRNMIEPDWLYLANLSKCQTSENFQEERHSLDNGLDQTEEKTNKCLDYARLSAQRALVSLRSIPLAARRGMPVLVTGEGLLLSIPSISFKHCPRLATSATFKPKVPLGRGHTSFI